MLKTFALMKVLEAPSEYLSVATTAAFREGKVAIQITAELVRAIARRVGNEIKGTLLRAAFTMLERVRPEDRGVYRVLLDRDRLYLARTMPRMFERDNKPIDPPKRIPVGSKVRLALDVTGWVEAVQVLSWANDSPFSVG